MHKLIVASAGGLTVCFFVISNYRSGGEFLFFSLIVRVAGRIGQADCCFCFSLSVCSQVDYCFCFFLAFAQPLHR